MCLVTFQLKMKVLLSCVLVWSYQDKLTLTLCLTLFYSGPHCAARPYQVYLMSGIARWNSDRSLDAVFGGKGQNHRKYSAPLIHRLNTRCDWRRISGPPPMLLPTSCLGWNIYSANARVYPNPFPWWTSSMMDLVQRRRWFSTGSPIQRLTRRTRATGRLVATCWMPSCPTLISPATKLQLFTLQPL